MAERHWTKPWRVLTHVGSYSQNHYHACQCSPINWCALRDFRRSDPSRRIYHHPSLFFYTGDNYPGKFCRNDPRSRSVMHKIQITQYDEPQPGRAIGIPVANQAAKNKLPAVLWGVKETARKNLRLTAPSFVRSKKARPDNLVRYQCPLLFRETPIESL